MKWGWHSDELIDAYDAFGHLGSCKHDKVGELDFKPLARFMETPQIVWAAMIRRVCREEQVDNQLELFRNAFAEDS